MWNLLKAAMIPLRVAAVIAFAYLGYVFVARHTSTEQFEAHQKRAEEALDPEQQLKQAKFDATYGGTALKILQFFARDGVITEGQETVVCYGVVNAKSVAIDPPIGKVYPAVNNCIGVQPAHDQEYKLTATGNDGQTLSAKFTVQVKADVGSLPRITQFAVVKHSKDAGKDYFTVAFKFENASSVRIDPEAFSPLEDSAPFGQIIVAPETTTTYTLTVTNKKGRTAQKKLTVEVPKG